MPVNLRQIGDLFGYRRRAVNDTNHDVFVLTKRGPRRVTLFNLNTRSEMKVSHHIFNVFYVPLSKGVRASQVQN